MSVALRHVRRCCGRLAVGCLLGGILSANASAQVAVQATNQVHAAPLPLSLRDAVDRGLEHNLAVIVEQQRIRETESDRLLALSALLPHVSGEVRQSRQVLNTAAFGFSFPGLPSLIGPFDVLDARISISAPLFDPRAMAGLRGGRALVDAGQANIHDVRETVVMAVGTLYLQAEADTARVESARAEVSTAEALARVAIDQREAGLVAGIDVLRQEVQVQSAHARLIEAENALAKRKLALARAIGVPAGQTVALTDVATFVPATPRPIDDAVEDAATHRGDLRAAEKRVDAARALRQAEAASRLPTLSLDADVGRLGPSASTLERTYSVAAVVHVPLFDGGATRARVRRADANLHMRESELADLKSALPYDVEAALLDVDAAEAAVQVADAGRRLAQQALDQAQDRFRAGVATTLELVQAQEAVASSAEHYIESVYAHAIAKATVARATGHVEQTFVALAGGSSE